MEVSFVLSLWCDSRVRKSGQEMKVSIPKSFTLSFKSSGHSVGVLKFYCGIDLKCRRDLFPFTLHFLMKKKFILYKLTFGNSCVLIFYIYPVIGKVFSKFEQLTVKMRGKMYVS